MVNQSQDESMSMADATGVLIDMTDQSIPTISNKMYSEANQMKPVSRTPFNPQHKKVHPKRSPIQHRMNQTSEAFAKIKPAVTPKLPKGSNTQSEAFWSASVVDFNNKVVRMSQNDKDHAENYHNRFTTIRELYDDK